MICANTPIPLNVHNVMATEAGWSSVCALFFLSIWCLIYIINEYILLFNVVKGDNVLILQQVLVVSIQ